MIPFVVIKQAGRKCPFCEKAIDLLDETGQAYKIRSLGIEALRAEAQKANMDTVPIVYHGVRLIGGYTELAAYLS